MSTNQNNTTSKTIVLLAMLLGVLLGVEIMSVVSRHKGVRNDGVGGKMDAIMQLIEQEYVDQIDRDSVSAEMINAMLAKLDPHSHYFTAEEIKQQEEEMQGGFYGIGVVLRYWHDTVNAGQVMAGSPAEKAGVMPGDIIMMVAGDSVSGVKMDPSDVVKRIRGPKGSKVTLTVERNGCGKPLALEVRRGLISTPSVPYSGMLNPKTGYIKITQFIETTYKEFHSALSELKKHKMERLIIDLRGNGGGLLDAAIHIANDLLPDGDLIVYTKGEHSRRDNTYSRGEAFYTGKVVVLIDEMSASASEVVSGAIQDNDRGTIVGRRSFGKGLVQRQFDMRDGSALWLTVARYYTPSGRCIQRPYDKGSDEYYSSYIEQMLQDMESDSIISAITDSTPYSTKKGRTVYGGGGIYPDRVLSYTRDTNLIYFNQLFNEGCISILALDYVAKNLPELRTKYPSADEFVKNFNVPDELMGRLFAMGEKSKIKYNPRSVKKYGGLMRTAMKAYIGESLFGTETFYRIYVTTDHELNQILNEKFEL